MYLTPCNIYKDERILKYDYNHGFRNFKICNICPKNAFIKSHKGEKSKTYARFEPMTYRLLNHPSTDRATWKDIKLSTNKTKW